MKDSAPELNVSSSETEEDKEEAKPDGEKDPDFNQVRLYWSTPSLCLCPQQPPAVRLPWLGIFWVPPYLFYTFNS